MTRAPSVPDKVPRLRRHGALAPSGATKDRNLEQSRTPVGNRRFVGIASRHDRAVVPVNSCFGSVCMLFWWTDDTQQFPPRLEMQRP